MATTRRAHCYGAQGQSSMHRLQRLGPAGEYAVARLRIGHFM